MFGLELNETDVCLDLPISCYNLIVIARDSYYLLKCWYSLVSLLGDHLSTLEFERSKKSMLQLYDFPRFGIQMHGMKA